MAGMIVVSSQITATNLDILSTGRLMTVPDNGLLTIELGASDCDATNRYEVSIKLPNGDIPVEDMYVPLGGAATIVGTLDERLIFKGQWRIGQGGHCIVSATETGTATMFYRIAFSPARRRG